MKKVYNLFGLPLTILLLLQLLLSIITVAAFSLRIQASIEQAILSSNLVYLSFIISFFTGAFYALKGLYLLFIIKKDKSKSTGKQQLKKGIIGMLAAFVIYFLVQYAATFYAVSMTSIGPPNSYR
jgi:hypothetical protein